MLNEVGRYRKQQASRNLRPACSVRLHEAGLCRNPAHQEVGARRRESCLEIVGMKKGMRKEFGIIRSRCTRGTMKAETKDLSMLERDILEWDIPEEVLAVLLKDRTTGRNLIWATDDYADRGKGFAAWRKSWLNEAGICRNSAHHEEDVKET